MQTVDVLIQANDDIKGLLYSRWRSSVYKNVCKNHILDLCNVDL